MSDAPSALGEGDASDLAWLELRVAETVRVYQAAQASLHEMIEGDPLAAGVPGLLDDLIEKQRAARTALAARDDAYAAQEALLPPPVPVFATPEERQQWYDRMRDEWIDAIHRLEQVEAEWAKLPAQAPLPDDMTSAEAMAIIEADEPYADRRIELILQQDAAEKDLRRAGAVIDAMDAEDDD